MCIIHSVLGLHVKGDEVVSGIAHELVGQNRHNCSAPGHSGQQLLQLACDVEFRVLRVR